jgi:hypothetical protein
VIATPLFEIMLLLGERVIAPPMTDYAANP